MSEDAASSAGWVPYRLRRDRSGVLVDWCRIRGNRLEEPFFDQSIHRILHEDHATRSTHFVTLSNLPVSRAPSGFMFHVSRCGSTLIAQMLASIERAAVFSEPAILEAVLRGAFANREAADEQKITLLKYVIGAFVASDPERSTTIVKFSARAVRDHALITRAYPGVPCLFVYRDPVEVLVSLAASMRDRLPPGLGQAGLLEGDVQSIQSLRPAEFWGRVVASQCDAALTLCARLQPLLVNYRELPQSVWTDIAAFFGIALSSTDTARMRDVSAHGAKNPSQPFVGDGAAKQAAASDEIRASADRYIRPYYERLEQLRSRRLAHTPRD